VIAVSAPIPLGKRLCKFASEADKAKKTALTSRQKRRSDQRRQKCKLSKFKAALRTTAPSAAESSV
jgi:hypothetical protein